MPETTQPRLESCGNIAALFKVSYFFFSLNFCWCDKTVAKGQRVVSLIIMPFNKNLRLILGML